MEESTGTPRPKSKIRKSSETVWQSHPSSRGMLGWYIKACLLALVVSIVAIILQGQGVFSMFWVVLIVLISFGGAFGLGKLVREATVFTITTRGVSEKKGLIATKKESASFENITNINVEQTLGERMLGIGRIDIFTAGETRRPGVDGYVNFWGIRRPHQIEALIEEERYKDEDYNAEDDI